MVASSTVLFAGEKIVLYEKCPCCTKVKKLGDPFAQFMTLEQFQMEEQAQARERRYQLCPDCEEAYMKQSHGVT